MVGLLQSRTRNGTQDVVHSHLERKVGPSHLWSYRNGQEAQLNLRSEPMATKKTDRNWEVMGQKVRSHGRLCTAYPKQGRHSCRCSTKSRISDMWFLASGWWFCSRLNGTGGGVSSRNAQQVDPLVLKSKFIKNQYWEDTQRIRQWSM